MLLTRLAICFCTAFLPTAENGGQSNDQILPESLRGLPLQKIKLYQNAIVAKLETETLINGFPCAAGYVHFTPSGHVKTFFLAKETVIQNNIIPRNTWVELNEEFNLKRCSFPRDTIIQGYLCRGGSGGAKGIRTWFYPSGKLEGFFAPKNIVVNNIPCKSSVFHPVYLYENGSLKECTLARDTIIGGKSFPKGTKIILDHTGEVVTSK
ncbi:MAG: hypothetical protein FWG02_05910 [Holophagaceae bacterium]|nr:hypothetical protein [Holophagaceae bacterium]